MLPFIVFGAIFIIGVAAICTFDPSSNWMPPAVILMIVGFLGLVFCLAFGTDAKSVLGRAEERGRELREFMANLEVLKDPLVKAKVVVESHEWNRTLEESRRGNASKWRDYFWADGWADLRPIEIK